jgi:hypothetical protein
MFKLNHIHSIHVKQMIKIHDKIESSIFDGFIGTDHQHPTSPATAGHDRQRFPSRRIALTCSGSAFSSAPRSSSTLDRGRIYQELAAVMSRRSRSVARRVQRGSQTLRRELEESQEVREEVRSA